MKKYNSLIDINNEETEDWVEEIEFIINNYGFDRAKFIILNLLKKYNSINNICKIKIKENNLYINSINIKNQKEYPGNLEIEKKIESFIRWNAVMIVLRAYKKNLNLGGHISSYQSSSTIYEVCFNNFFKSRSKNSEGDLIYFQGHSSPGIYSRAFIENRLKIENLDNFRQETNNNGLSSYPHPRLMPNFWEFPTVSMGLSSISSIYQAKFLKYLNNRNLKDCSNRTVYVFLGDGEMDEPESRGALHIASRDKLDNLIFIINCNLQRLDGPVFGNGKIIFELENLFLGCKWNVIKVIHGSKWDNLFQNDKNGMLIKLFNETNDGNIQNMMSKDGNYIRKNFFGKYKETENLVKNMTDEEIYNLNFGGHDFKKIFSAIYEAKKSNMPTAILIHSIKGFGIKEISSKNISHQIKNIDFESLKSFRKFLSLENIINDDHIKNLSYINFNKNSIEMNYIEEKRKKLSGYVPNRRTNCDIEIIIPELSIFNDILKEQKKEISTTMIFSKILNILLNNKNIKNHIVPIIADEGRTFGLESFFNKIGIYNPNGQQYISQDSNSILSYNEKKDGQILQEGISELGASCSWLAAATSYSTNNFPMIPFYIYYSMFGFQRVGDLYWMAGDQLAKGFLIGATSGKTTLNGEGLQHQDGNSHIHSSLIPSCISYNPAFSYEMSIIIHDGLKRMYGIEKENIFYYITVANENYCMPAIPKKNDIIEGICKGIYLLKKNGNKNINIQLLGSGSILNNIIKASEILLNDYNISSYIYSVTSFTEIYRDGNYCNKWNLINANKNKKIPYIKKVLLDLPTVVSTDYIKLYAEQIREFLPNNNYYVLGTDGFGLSDSRENLRNYFGISEYYIVISSLYLLYKCNKINFEIFYKSIKRFNINSI